MRYLAALTVWCALWESAPAAAQTGYGRRRTSVATATSGPYQGPAVTFQGTLKALSKKEIIIDLDGEDQTLTLRRSGKTKFSQGDREIKPSDIQVGTHVTIDATREGDQKIAALHVMIAPPAK